MRVPPSCAADVVSDCVVRQAHVPTIAMLLGVMCMRIWCACFQDGRSCVHSMHVSGDVRRMLFQAISGNVVIRNVS